MTGHGKGDLLLQGLLKWGDRINTRAA